MSTGFQMYNWREEGDRKSTRLNSSHDQISYAVFCLKKKTNYFRSFIQDAFGINIPDWLATDFRIARKIPGLLEHAPHIFGYPIVSNILAFGIVALITVVLVWGIKE